MFFMTLLSLALLDSLSTGTLVIPLIFLAQPRFQVRTLALYCFPLGLFYTALGTLFAYGVLSPSPDSRASEIKWRTRLEKVTNPRAAIFIALLAGVLEAATMLPYLAAISMLNTWDSTIITKLIVLMGYCLIMFIPAVTLLVIRRLASSWITPKLDHFVSLATRNADGAILWIAAIIGFLMARQAYTEIF